MKSMEFSNDILTEVQQLRCELAAFHNQWATANGLLVQPPLGPVPTCKECGYVYTICNCRKIYDGA